MGAIDVAEGIRPADFSREQRNRFVQPSTRTALAWFVPELMAWAGFTVLAVSALPWPFRLAAAIMAGMLTGTVFTVGHDAAHQALTPSRRLNLWIARIAFIPSAHAVSLWEVGHNRIHHRYTNLLGWDYVWEPMTPQSYAAASPARRLLYRLYRGPAGHLPYYLIEMWLKKNLLPIAPELRKEWRRHLPDTVFVLFAQAVLTAGVIAAGRLLAPGRPWGLAFLFGWAIPFLYWNWLMGLVIYLHHTNPAIPWYRRREDWNAHRARTLGTAQASLPGFMNWIDNNIMCHAAHHVLPSIPMYRLKQAQEALLEAADGIIAFKAGLTTVLPIVSACKLFDPERRLWCDFDGRPTSPPLYHPPGRV